MKGKLIVIEGLDSSGKATQTQKLYETLLTQGKRVKKVEFPNYQSPSSALIKMYLSGEFGQTADSVGPYEASCFYTLDRYASYKTEWEAFYKDGGIVLADRYTTSNMIHQASKITDMKEKEAYLRWLADFEYGMFKLPRPDGVFFLDMPPPYAIALMRERSNKFTGEKQKDIHEKDEKYLQTCYESALMVAEKYGFVQISCVEEGKVLSIDAVFSKIMEHIKELNI